MIGDVEDVELVLQVDLSSRTMAFPHVRTVSLHSLSLMNSLVIHLSSMSSTPCLWINLDHLSVQQANLVIKFMNPRGESFVQ